MILVLGACAGAGGYLGTEVTKQLLDRGFTVRATVRKASQANVRHLENLAKALPGRLEVIEADLGAKGSFNEAMEGATYV